ncbi:MAG TPA: amidohydrolase family protein [Saprospiraceae bacterium]|nr:amidohydrolase family protein [Saprospiraceae bacterium]
MRKLTADVLFHNGCFRRNLGLVIDRESKILEVNEVNDANRWEYEFFPGILSPGFVNCHCHLELSHLRSKFDTGTGLIHFLHSVVSQREIEQEVIDAAILEADRQMWSSGIQAVGDICNKLDTLSVKLKSKISYYSFIESFDFLQDQLCDQMTQSYADVFHQWTDQLKSFVPHAPYSVSKTLFEKINLLNSKDAVLSIHNQELDAEDALFEFGDRRFLQFFEQFGFGFEHFKPSGKKSIYTVLESLSADFQLLFVHNTMTELAELKFVKQNRDKAFFITCPQANLFIENRLPNYRAWIEAGVSVGIGTDSLSSNWSLDILEEIKTISKFHSWIPLEQLFQWATINGAKALKMENTMGNFESGKAPGIVWIKNIDSLSEIRLTKNSVAQRIS